MFGNLLLTSLLAVQAASAVLPQQQQPLRSGHSQSITRPKRFDLIEELTKAEIIPAILAPFTPKLAITITWPNASVEIGDTLPPSKIQSSPSISFLAPDAHRASKIRSPLKKETQLTLALTDPDAPSRDNPEWSQICHWIITGVPLKPLSSLAFSPSPFSGDGWEDAFEGLEEIMPWKPPGPPPKTGKHRYVFVALAPKNGTTQKLELSKPGDRQHWGYGSEGERQGVGKWAEENGLEAVGANFIYSQNDEQ